MKKIRKQIVAAVFAAAVGAGTIAYADNVGVSARVSPKNGISLNFDSIIFSGLVGSLTNTASYAKGGTPAGGASMTIRSNTNYTVSISGTDFSGGGTTLNVQRLSVKVNTGTAQAVTSAPTSIDSGNAFTGTKNQNLYFDLNLNDQGNTFGDEANLAGLAADTDFSNTVTISYTGA